MKFTPFIYNKMMPVINLRVSTSINANLVPRQLGKKILKEESEGTLRLLLESLFIPSV